MKLSEEAREYRNKKAREYYANHREQYKETMRRYWEKKAAAQREAKEELTNKSKAELEANYWICRMVLSNWNKTYDKGLFPVSQFVAMCAFSGISETRAKKTYNYILTNSNHEIFPVELCLCYVSGDNGAKWKEDFFVIPCGEYTEQQWYNRALDLMVEIGKK